MGSLVVAPDCHEHFAFDDGTEIDGKIRTRAEASFYFKFSSAASYCVYDMKSGRFNRH